MTVSGSPDFKGFFITVRDAQDTVVETGVFAVSGDDIQINCDMVRENHQGYNVLLTCVIADENTSIHTRFSTSFFYIHFS